MYYLFKILFLFLCAIMYSMSLLWLYIRMFINKDWKKKNRYTVLKTKVPGLIQLLVPSALRWSQWLTTTLHETNFSAVDVIVGTVNKYKLCDHNKRNPI